MSWMFKCAPRAILGLAFVLGSAVAQAANVAFWSDEYGPELAASLTPPHTVTAVTQAEIDSGALSAYDVLLLGHLTRTTLTAATCDRIKAFLAAGKGVVTEWNGATLIFNSTPESYHPMQPSCALMAGSAVDGDSTFGSGVPIAVVDAANPLVAGLPSSFDMGRGSEFVWQITGHGPEWKVAATFNGNGTTFPAVMSTRLAGGGCLALSPFDYFDASDAGGTQQASMERLLANMVGWAANRAYCRAVPAEAITAVPTLSPTMLVLLSAMAAGLMAFRRRKRG